METKYSILYLDDEEKNLRVFRSIFKRKYHILTTTSIEEALKLLKQPIIEVHISNPGARETFRHQSFITPVAMGVIAGLGANSYVLALDALYAHLSE